MAKAQSDVRPTRFDLLLWKETKLLSEKKFTFDYHAEKTDKAPFYSIDQEQVKIYDHFFISGKIKPVVIDSDTYFLAFAGYSKIRKKGFLSCRGLFKIENHRFQMIQIDTKLSLYTFTVKDNEENSILVSPKYNVLEIYQINRD